MKANELRIGNKLLKDGVVVTIDARTIFDIWDDNGLKKYEPIPITEEWLIRFGFEKDGGEYNSPSDEFDIIIHVSEDGDRYTASNVFVGRVGNWDRDGVNYICMGNCFKYVHQLQNLYFALTNTELVLQKLTI